MAMAQSLVGPERGFLEPSGCHLSVRTAGRRAPPRRKHTLKLEEEAEACEPWEDFNLNKAEGYTWIGKNKRIYYIIAYIFWKPLFQLLCGEHMGTSEAEIRISRRLWASLLAQ